MSSFLIYYLHYTEIKTFQVLKRLENAKNVAWNVECSTSFCLTFCRWWAPAVCAKRHRWVYDSTHRWRRLGGSFTCPNESKECFCFFFHRRPLRTGNGILANRSGCHFFFDSLWKLVDDRWRLGGGAGGHPVGQLHEPPVGAALQDAVHGPQGPGGARVHPRHARLQAQRQRRGRRHRQTPHGLRFVELSRRRPLRHLPFHGTAHAFGLGLMAASNVVVRSQVSTRRPCRSRCRARWWSNRPSLRTSRRWTGSARRWSASATRSTRSNRSPARRHLCSSFFANR